MYKIIAICMFSSSVLAAQMDEMTESELHYDYANAIEREEICVYDSDCIRNDHFYRKTTGAVCNPRVEECTRR